MDRSTIKLLPWWEGYHNALDDKNTVIFALAISLDRERFFKWVGPGKKG
jgi:hypothetical protein